MAGKVSPASDVYSFGVILWCLAHSVLLRWALGSRGARGVGAARQGGSSLHVAEHSPHLHRWRRTPCPRALCAEDEPSVAQLSNPPAPCPTRRLPPRSQLRHLLPGMYSPVGPTLLAHASPRLPPGLMGLLRRCLAAQPGARPSAAALVEDLKQLLQVGSRVG